jgi:hypothetical protein
VNIVELETRNNGRDWPLIVMAVPCPTCGAPIGEYCTTLRSTDPNQNTLLNTGGAQRIDWHAERKNNAAQLWYAQKTVQQETKIAAGDPSATNRDEATPAEPPETLQE